MAQGSANFIYKNNFVNNQRQVVLDKTWNVLQWDLTEYYPDAINGTDSASWHKDNMGNYWSDYFGVDDDGDGIGDSQYLVYENMTDNYPLMMPTETSAIPSTSPEPTLEPTPEPEPFPTTLVIASVTTIAVVGAGLLVYFKKRKH